MDRRTLAIVIIIIGLLLLAYVGYFSIKPAEATFIPKVNICHCEGADCQTLNIAVAASIAHLQQHDDDYPGVCSTPAPTASPSATPAPTEIPVPCFGEESLKSQDWVVIPCPTATPEPTAAPTPGLTDPQGPFDAPAGPVCTEIKFTPTVVGVKRIDSDTVWIDWTSVDEHVKSYKVEYSLGKGFVMWNTIVTGATETELHFLPAWLPIWVHVAGVSEGGCVGTFSEWIDP